SARSGMSEHPSNRGSSGAAVRSANCRPTPQEAPSVAVLELEPTPLDHTEGVSHPGSASWSRPLLAATVRRVRTTTVPHDQGAHMHLARINRKLAMALAVGVLAAMASASAASATPIDSVLLAPPGDVSFGNAWVAGSGATTGGDLDWNQSGTNTN